MRYEDLILNPHQTITDVIRFILDVPSIEDTVAEFQVAKATQGNYDQTKTYALKSGAGQLNRHMEKYTEEIIKNVKKTARRGLEFWGYTYNEKDPDN